MATTTHNGFTNQSLGELTSRLSEGFSRLLHAEADLARAEVGEKARAMAVGAGFAAAAMVLTVAALGALTAAAILALATTIAPWLAALVVAVVVAVVASLLAVIAMKRVRRAAPPVPAETVNSVKEDIAWLKTSAKPGKR